MKYFQIPCEFIPCDLFLINKGSRTQYFRVLLGLIISKIATVFQENWMVMRVSMFCFILYLIILLFMIPHIILCHLEVKSLTHFTIRLLSHQFIFLFVYLFINFFTAPSLFSLYYFYLLISLPSGLKS